MEEAEAFVYITYTVWPPKHGLSEDSNMNWKKFSQAWNAKKPLKVLVSGTARDVE